MNRLFNSELKIMNILWKEGAVPAKYIARVLEEKLGWNKNTTYTLIKRCIKKEAIERSEPNFVCNPLISKEQVQNQEIEDLINKIFDGSTDMLFASLLRRKNLSYEQIKQLKQIVGDFGGDNK